MNIITPFAFQVLGAINDCLFRNREEPDWTNRIDLTVSYALPKTVVRCSPYFNSRGRSVQDFLSMDWWYRVADTEDGDAETYACKLQYQPPTGLTAFVLTQNGHLLCSAPSSTSTATAAGIGATGNPKILSVVINGSPNSLFRTHFPEGLDVSLILGPVLEEVLVSKTQVRAEQLLPPVLMAAIGDTIKYDKTSLSILVLYDESFDEEEFGSGDILTMTSA